MSVKDVAIERQSEQPTRRSGDVEPTGDEGELEPDTILHRSGSVTARPSEGPHPARVVQSFVAASLHTPGVETIHLSCSSRQFQAHVGETVLAQTTSNHGCGSYGCLAEQCTHMGKP